MPLEPIHEIDLDPSEADTRRLLIDTQLSNVGWIKGKDWFEEQELRGMPNSKGVGFADYVLFHDKEPYAVVEPSALPWILSKVSSRLSSMQIFSRRSMRSVR